MERAKLFAILLALPCLLCGCASYSRQDKADITPFQLAENISFRKELISLNGVELSSPRQITSNGESLFICDAGNSRIIRYDFESGKTTALGQLGEFIEPACIASSDSHLCVYDRGSSRIQALNFDGEPVWEHCLDGEFDFLSEVVGVEICDDGAVYFSLIAYDKHTSSSGIYQLKNDKLKKISDYTVGALCSGGENGNLYLCDTKGSAVYKPVKNE